MIYSKPYLALFGFKEDDKTGFTEYDYMNLQHHTVFRSWMDLLKGVFEEKLEIPYNRKTVLKIKDLM